MDTSSPSLAQELSLCRKHLQISQLKLARMMNLKTHRLADLEKARSQPTEAEACRVRQQVRQLMEQWELLKSGKVRASDPRLAGLRELSGLSWG